MSQKIKKLVPEEAFRETEDSKKGWVIIRRFLRASQSNEVTLRNFKYYVRCTENAINFVTAL
jgi:hypothetical protein